MLAKQVNSFRQLIPGASNVSVYNGKVILPSWENFALDDDYYNLVFQDPFGITPTWYAESSSFSVRNSNIRITSGTPTPTKCPTSRGSGLTEGAKVGIGVGIGLGVPILATLTGLLLAVARRRPAPASAPASPTIPASQSPEYGSPPASYAETPFTTMAHVPSQQTAWVQPDPANVQYAVPPNELPPSGKTQAPHEMPS